MVNALISCSNSASAVLLSSYMCIRRVLGVPVYVIGKARRFCQLDFILPSFFGLKCMVKVFKPFYARKCIVGWLGYTVLRMCRGCKDVLDTDQDESSVSTKWGDNMGLRSPHFVLTEHTLVLCNDAQ